MAGSEATVKNSQATSMPKYKAEIFPRAGGSSYVAYVESDDQWCAEALLKLQYPDSEVRWLQEVPAESPASSSTQDASDVASDSGSAHWGFREFLLLVVIAVGILGYRWFKDTFVAPSQPAEVAADLATGVEAPGAELIEPPVESTAARPAPMPGQVAEPVATDSREDAASQPASQVEPPRLQPFQVVVLTAAGGEEALTISARDEAHALKIVRDFRGNPPVVRVEQP
jgi:cytoskeletal protein RodZ